MPPTDVVVIRTGSANLASVVALFDRMDVRTRVTESPEEVVRAPFVVLPGVGAFGPAMQRLEALGLGRALVERVRTERPLLAICLGLQLLCESSAESPGVRGLGIVPRRVTRFDAGLAVPHMGWNQITSTDGASLLRGGAFYFANSYRLEHIPLGWEGARFEYGGRFVAAIERGAILACQFHPELSGVAGRSLVQRWIAATRAAEEAPC